MSNIIKRRHTSQYTQIHNGALQTELDDLRAIGLLSHIMSLPAEWVIRKTQLQSKFGRRPVDSAWKVLVEKGYIIGFVGYIGKLKSYFYLVSDIPFSEEDYVEFVKETIEETKETITSIKPIPDCIFSTEHFVQYTNNSTNRANINKELINKDLKTNNKILNNKEIDDDKANSVAPAPKQIESLTDVINSLRLQTQELLTKRSFDSVLRKVVDKYEQGKVANFRDYLVTSLNAKIEELELRRIKEQAKQSLARTSQSGASEEYAGKVLFYNFLDQSEGDKPLKK